MVDPLLDGSMLVVEARFFLFCKYEAWMTLVIPIRFFVDMKVDLHFNTFYIFSLSFVFDIEKMKAKEMGS